MSDEQMRCWEREAAQGDPWARKRLFWARHALALCMICGRPVGRQPHCIFDRPFTCEDCQLERIKARAEHWRRTGRDTPEQEQLTAWLKTQGLP